MTTADLLAHRPDAPDPEDDACENYAHLLIDEAQDVTPMQWRMLRRRGTQASWTVVEDNDKFYGRVKTLQTLVKLLENGLSAEGGSPGNSLPAKNGKLLKKKK